MSNLHSFHFACNMQEFVDEVLKTVELDDIKRRFSREARNKWIILGAEEKVNSRSRTGFKPISHING